MIKVLITEEYSEWFQEQTAKAQVQIDDRLSKIQYEEHFGDHRFVGSSEAAVWELKWRSGRRVYYAYLLESHILILLAEEKMHKTKTSIKQSGSLINTSNKPKRLKTGLGVKAYNPTKALLDEDKIGRAIWECLKNEDTDGVIEVISIHLEALNKTQIIRDTQIPKTTFYHSLRSKNPTLKTLAKLVHACA